MKLHLITFYGNSTLQNIFQVKHKEKQAGLRPPVENDSQAAGNRACVTE
jgi:hypothetical protein